MLNKFVIQKNKSIKDGMIKIEKNSIGALFILNKKKLIGIVTDGDIRRSVISGKKIDEQINKIMNKNFIKIKNNFTRGKILETISKTLATIWSYRVCFGQEALVIICPEHAVTLARDGFTKQLVREFLFENTGVPVRTYDNADGEGVQQATRYDRVEIQGEPCYRKFETPEAIRVIVAGGAPVTCPIG